MTDNNTTNFEQSLMDICSAFIANPQPSELMQPRQCAFDHPAKDTQTAAVFSSAFGQYRLNSFLTNFFTVRFGIVASIIREHNRVYSEVDLPFPR